MGPSRRRSQICEVAQERMGRGKPVKIIPAGNTPGNKDLQLLAHVGVSLLC